MQIGGRGEREGKPTKSKKKKKKKKKEDLDCVISEGADSTERVELEDVYI